MLLHCSHLVVATEDVPRINQFFQKIFSVKPHFENEMFCEFVLPSQFRIAFFKPVGKAADFFSAEGKRENTSFGVTVKSVDALFAHLEACDLPSLGARVSGPPKEHPWGEKSFLLVDPDGNRWEVTQSPTDSGHLVNR